MGTMQLRPHRRWYALLFWMLFAAGLIVQFLAPRLEISDGKYVLPPELVNGTAQVDPQGIIRKERRMHLISAILTSSGAIGLAFLYWNVLVRRGLREETPGNRIAIPIGKSTQKSHR